MTPAELLAEAKVRAQARYDSQLESVEAARMEVSILDSAIRDLTVRRDKIWCFDYYQGGNRLDACRTWLEHLNAIDPDGDLDANVTLQNLMEYGFAR